MKHSIIYLNAFPDKKIKSIGNKGLIKLSNSKCLIDYNINILNKYYSNSEIIIVSGFESKKLFKYLNHTNAFAKSKNNILYTEHNPDDGWNVGKSISTALVNNTSDTATIYSSSLFIDPKVFDKIKKQPTSFVLSRTGKNDGVGCITNDDMIAQCFYGLENTIYDFVYLDQKAFDFLKQYIKYKNIDKLYLFEIINLCIDNGIQMKLFNINKKLIQIIDSTHSINVLKNKIKNYVK
jgi:hypothetical protein